MTERFGSAAVACVGLRLPCGDVHVIGMSTVELVVAVYLGSKAAVVAAVEPRHALDNGLVGIVRIHILDFVCQIEFRIGVVVVGGDVDDHALSDGLNERTGLGIGVGDDECVVGGLHVDIVVVPVGA